MARLVHRSDIENELGVFDDLQEIGAPSGSGECWRGEQGGDVLAVKIIVNEHEPGRFQREVEALKRLDTPRVMRVRSDGTLRASNGRDYPYLVSEFVEGGDLKTHMASGPPSDSQLRSFLLELLEGLRELHEAGVVHRDLKPENIVLRDGQWASPVIIDLGLSRLVDAATFTVYPWAFGTWPYMAPEQLAAERAVDRTDIWAVAVVAAELARGDHPFRRAGENTPPGDWDSRLRGGLTIPGSRPAALHDLLGRTGDYRAYRRPSAADAIAHIEGHWS